jgi:hypothetical protein
MLDRIPLPSCRRHAFGMMGRGARTESKPQVWPSTHTVASPLKLGCER